MTRRPRRLETALLLAPAVTLLLAVAVLPVLRVLALAFMSSDVEGGLALRFAGLEPLRRLAHDGRFRADLATTAVFTLASVALEMLLGFAVALLLHRRFPGRGLVRAAVLVPWALPTAVMALAWSWIFNDTFGVANDLLLRAGLVRHGVAWLAHPKTAMAALVLADVWKTTPFVAVVLLAGLQSIPEDVLDAARVEGLSALQRMRHIVLPLLAPSIAIAAAFRLLQAYGAFDIVYAMTGGGPGGSTETVSLYAFRSTFRYLDVAYGATIAVFGVLPVVALVALALRLLRGREEAS